MAKDQRILPHRRRKTERGHHCQQCDGIHGALVVEVTYTVFDRILSKTGCLCRRCLTGDISCRWNVIETRIVETLVCLW